MIYRTSNDRIQDYYDNPAINQSGLKVILNQGIQIFKRDEETIKQDLYYEEKGHFILGKAIDCLLTEGKEEFKRQFFISTLQKKPSDTLMSLIQMAFDMSTFDGADIELVNFKQVLHESLKKHVDKDGKQLYYDNRKKDNWQEDTRIDSILKDPNNHLYWNELIEANGKQILTDTDKAIIFGNVERIGLYDSFTKHKNTAFLFDPKLEDSTIVDVVFQFPIYETIDDIETKKLLDCIYIDHNRKLIKPLDIKTTREPILLFNTVVKSRRYDMQASFYYDALKRNLDKLSILLRKDVTDYIVSTFAFVVESTTLPGTPLIFPISEDILNCGRYGNGVYMQGYTQALNIYKFWKNVNFEIDKVYPSGVLFIDDNFEYRIN